MKPNTIILGWPNAWRKREEESWRVFVDTIRNTAAAKMALLVPKGVQRYPDSGVSTIVLLFSTYIDASTYHCHKPVLLGKGPLLQVCYKL